MPKIEREIYINYEPERVFEKMSSFDFMNKINATVAVDSQILFQNERIIRYIINVKNIGSWESERVLIPEKNLIIMNRRTPLTPFKYMVVIYSLTKHTKGTCLKYIEEFEVEDESSYLEGKIMENILEKIEPILERIGDYFNQQLE